MIATPNQQNPLSRSLNLCQRLSDLESLLLSQSHDLESLEIRKSLSAFLLAALLGPGTLLPLCLNSGLLPLRLDNTSSGSSWELLEDEGSEDNFGKGDRLAWYGGLGICGWSVDKSLYFNQSLRFHLPDLPDSQQGHIRACGR